MFFPNLMVEHWSFVPKGVDRSFRLKHSCKSWAFVYAKYFPFRYALLFTLRRFLRFTNYCIKNGISINVILSAIGKGILSFCKTYFSKTHEKLPQDIVQFYLNPNIVPSFDTKPLFLKK
jgi:hypothetical protein